MSRPVGWRDEPARHSLASRGIKTALFSRAGNMSIRRAAAGPPKALRYGGSLRGNLPNRYEWGYEGAWHSSFILKKTALPDDFFSEAGVPKQELWELASYMPVGYGAYASAGQWFFLSKEDAFYNLRHDLNSSYEVYNQRNMKPGSREIPINQMERYFTLIRSYVETHPAFKEKLRQEDELEVKNYEH